MCSYPMRWGTSLELVSCRINCLGVVDCSLGFRLGLTSTYLLPIQVLRAIWSCKDLNSRDGSSC